MTDRITAGLMRLYEDQGHRIVFWYDAVRDLRAAFDAVDLPGVTKVEIANPARPTVAPPKTDKPKAAAAPAPVSTAGWKAAGSSDGAAAAKEEEPILPRELRVVAGQELPNVRLEVDLYRFAEVAVAEEGEVIP